MEFHKWTLYQLCWNFAQLLIDYSMILFLGYSKVSDFDANLIDKDDHMQVSYCRSHQNFFFLFLFLVGMCECAVLVVVVFFVVIHWFLYLYVPVE